MNVDLFFQTFGSQFQELKSYLWKDDTLPRMQEQSDRLGNELRRCYPVLIQHRTLLDGLRRQVTEMEGRLAQLTLRVETFLHVEDHSQAWRHALEADQIRTSLGQERVKLQRQEGVYHAHLTNIEQLKKRLNDLHQTISLRRQWQD